MTSIGTAAPFARGILVRRADKTPYAFFHPLPHVGSLPVTARCPSSFLEPEFYRRRRCSAGAASTSSSSGSATSFGSCHFSSPNETLCNVRFGWGSHGIGGRRHGFRVCRSTEDGGGEKGGGNSTSTATEDPEKDPNSSDSSSTPSTPPPVCVPFASHLSFHHSLFSFILNFSQPVS